MPMDYIILASTLVLLTPGVLSVTFTINNSYTFSVWPGWLNGEGPPILQGGLELKPFSFVQLDIPQGWGGRFWGRTGCKFDMNTNLGSCETGDCGNGLYCHGAGGAPPATLVEIKLNGYANRDFYDVSLVDGYNLPVKMCPLGAGCTAVGCQSDVNLDCPTELRVVDGARRVVACKSSCDAFQLDEYCCRGPYNSPRTCLPTAYSKRFKKHCPQAYSYAYDDLTSTFTCSSGAGYVIQFCPQHSAPSPPSHSPPPPRCYD